MMVIKRASIILNSEILWYGNEDGLTYAGHSYKE